MLNCCKRIWSLTAGDISFTCCLFIVLLGYFIEGHSDGTIFSAYLVNIQNSTHLTGILAIFLNTLNNMRRDCLAWHSLKYVLKPNLSIHDRCFCLHLPSFDDALFLGHCLVPPPHVDEHYGESRQLFLDPEIFSLLRTLSQLN